MPVADEVIVRFKTEGGKEIEEAFKRASGAGELFHGVMKRAGTELDGLRAKSEGRIAANIGQIARQLSSGAGAADIFTNSVTRLGESFKGSLIFSGAAAAGYGLYEAITRPLEAIIKLRSEVDQLTRPTGRGDFLGSNQISQNLENVTAKIKEIQQSQILSSNSILRSAVTGPLGGLLGAGARPIANALFGALDKEREEQILRLRKSGVEALGQEGTKISNINDALREKLTGSERQAALDQESIESNERLGQITASAAAAGVQGRTEAESGEISRANLETAAINKQFNIQQKGFELQKKIAGTERELLAPADENLQILDQRLAATQDILDHVHTLTDEEREQYHIQRDQLEATKQRAQFTRQLERDLAGIEFGRVRGAIGGDRSRIASAQRQADQARVFGANSPEFLRAQAGLEDEQFRQFGEYEKNPGAFRQKRIDEQFQRRRFQYLRSSGQLPDDISSQAQNLRPPPSEQNASANSPKDVLTGLSELINTLNALPERIGVG